MTRPLPSPSPSTTAMDRSLCSDGFCKPSSMTIALAPSAIASRAPAGRSRETMAGAIRAREGAARRRRRAAPWRPGSTRTGPAGARHSRGRERTGARPPRSASCASARAVGVLPAPPAVKLPTQITGTPARSPARAHAPRRDGAVERRSTGVSRRAGNGTASARPRRRAPASAPRLELHLSDEGLDRLHGAVDRARRARATVSAACLRHVARQGRDPTEARASGARQRRARRGTASAPPAAIERVVDVARSCGRAARAGWRAPSFAGSIGLWPPCGTSEPPMKTRGARR